MNKTIIVSSAAFKKFFALTDQEFLPNRIRTGSGTTRRFSRVRMTSESAYRGFSASIALNSLTKSSGSFWGSRNQTTPNTSPLRMSEKSVSFVTTMRSSATETLASVLSPLDFFATVKSTFCSESSVVSSMRTFSSSRNRIGVDDDIVVASERACVLQSGGDLLSREWSEKSVFDIFDALPGRKHFHNLPDHNARPFEGGLAVANLGVGDDVFVDDDAFVHNVHSITPSHVGKQDAKKRRFKLRSRLVEDMVTHKPMHYLIKSDWKLHDVVKKIEEILETQGTV